MPYFLDKYLSGMSIPGFFEHFGMDAIEWVTPVKPDISRGERFVAD